MDAVAAEKYIVEKLASELPETLFYHGLHHVLDVTNAALQLASQEGITDTESLSLLRTAALYHDCGFLSAYANHEEEGCKIVREILPAFEFSDVQIGAICGMIMATRIPQSPRTHLEKILCDADLDYLGRTDFESIANTLFDELKARSRISDLAAWNETQVKFIGTHSYWTESAKQNREHTKQAHLASLMKTRH